MKPKFTLPKTKLSTVVWHRNGARNETLIDTPRSSDALLDLMLMRHHVGFGEIRVVKAVDVKDLLRGSRAAVAA